MTVRPKFDEWAAGTLAKTVDVHVPDFTSDLTYSDQTLNMTSGIMEGIGPRYGFSAIPGQTDQETVAAGQYAGLMKLEQDANTPRVNVFAVYPLRLGGAGTNINTVSTYYMWVIGYNSTYATGLQVDALLSSTAPGGVITQSTSIASGLAPGGPISAAVTSGSSSNLVTLLGIPAPTAATSAAAAKFLTVATGTKHISSTAFAVAGIQVPAHWLYGATTATGGATTPPSIQLIGLAQGAGLISPFNYQNYSQESRTLSVWSLDAGKASLNISYSFVISPSATIYKALYTETGNSPQIDLSSITASGGPGSSYGSTATALFNDQRLSCDSSYQGVMIAADKAICVLVQDWARNGDGQLNQYVDLAHMVTEPPIAGTQVQNGVGVPCVFVGWPTFTAGTALAATGSKPRLGAANSGVLRANTVYEFSYSLYNKRLNFESNVGLNPAVFQVGNGTGSQDLFSLQLFDKAWGANLNLYPSNFIPQPVYLNHMEVRFYYRQQGMQEWIPALFVDAAQLYLYPWNPLVACGAPLGALPGGRAGGFVDYSKLPDDKYNCVVMFQNRAFWLSSKSLTFSLRNNIFAYPQGNSAACPVGSFKGAIIQAYYGQADQSARLVVFGTTQTYVGKFTGNLLSEAVQVDVPGPGGSPTVATLPVDGSDFVLNAWTSVTAFSYRAACVAEGILYFWGPQGIFMDNGVDPLARISVPLEPTIFNLYDASMTDDINCVYNDTSKEIQWFYPAKVQDLNQSTRILTWNTVKKTWLLGSTHGAIDAAQLVKIDSPSLGTAGTRIFASVRENAGTNLQRAYFYDQNNLAGDMRPSTELIIKSFTTPQAGQRRLHLAAGYYAPLVSEIVAGDNITFQQLLNYTNGALTNTPDFIASVVSANSGAGTIDIALPEGITFDASATIATNANYFPVWHAHPATIGLNGIPWVLDTKYWIPGGMSYWAYWLYLHLFVKLKDQLPTVNPQDILLSYRTPISSGDLSDTLAFVDNSDANWQILHPLHIGNQNLEGQGLKLSFSGIQIGGSWMLQYLQTFTSPLDGLQLKLFEE